MVLDAGAFIALERSDPYVAKLLARLVRAKVPLLTSGGVLAQVWRGGAGRQAPVAMMLPMVDVSALDRNEGKLVGLILATSGTRDPVDGHVVLLARERSWPVITSDPDDLHAIDPRLELILV